MPVTPLHDFLLPLNKLNPRLTIILFIPSFLSINQSFNLENP